jgi:choice-of-anchor B domain-containing protein
MSRTFRLALAAIALGAAPLSAQTWLDANASPAELAQFGFTVALAGDAAFIGEPTSTAHPGGLVHVYRRGPTGWRSASTITRDSAAAGTLFGTALAASGNTLLVGMRNVPDSARGGVRVYTRAANGSWTDAGALGGVPAARSGFGWSVAIEGDWAFVGAPTTQPGGAVHVFRRSGTSWTAAGTLPAADIAAGDRFGAALAVDGERVAVAAPGRDSQKGMIYVFRRGADGSFTQEGAVAGRRIPANGQLGAALLLSGDQLWAGAPNANGFIGMVVGFSRNAEGAWVEGATLSPFETSPNRFGAALAMVGNELWIGAPFSDAREGRIYRAARTASGGLTGMTKMGHDSLTPGSQFGAGLAVMGSTAAVAMPADAGNQGTVIFLDRNTAGTWVSRSIVFPATAEFASVTGRPEARCDAAGKAGEFGCSNTSLLSFLPISQIGGRRGTNLNDNWGWTDSTSGKEYAIVGRTDGTSFVDISNPSRPVYLGDLPKTEGSPSAAWRDMKVYKNHVFIVADASGDHGMQVFDLTRLRTIRTPQRFTPDAHYTRIGSAHNIVLNEESGFAYAVGTSSGGETCGGGLHMIDVRDPKNPTFAGCFSDPRTGNAGTGYSHDAQCVIYRGPDATYRGKEICVGSNETAISIADVTDKANPVAISRASYPDVAYAHQGWFSDDHRYFYLDDEGDESSGRGEAAKGTRTLVFDLADLDDPIMAKEYVGTTKAIDHNLYVKGNRVYQANYTSGLRILDISDPVNPREVGYFDTYPTNDATAFNGAWSTYPYFKSGAIVVTGIGEGLFLVRDRTQAVP